MGQGYSIRAKADTAEIYIYEDVGSGWFGGVSAKQFADDLRGLGSISQIDLRINSFGGEVFDGLAIYRQLVEHPARIVTHVDGVAASIASVIAMAGDEIQIAEAGFMMIHDASGGCFGCAEDMRALADTLDAITGAIIDVYAARTKNAKTDLEAWMDAESWFTAADCVANGFADSVVDNMRIAAHADLSKHKFQNAPSGLLGLRSDAAVSPLAAPPSLPPVGAAAARQSIERMKARLILAR